jgi:hypothetical protein
MSAKGRGRHEGGVEDYYPTPAWCVWRLLDRIGSALPLAGHWLEPTAGDGAVARAVEEWCVGEGHEPRWTLVELRAGALRGMDCGHRLDGTDYLTWRHGYQFALALGNPPYSIAEKIIRKALDEADIVAMLLRTGFLGSDERVDFWRTVGANPALYVLPDRPSFDGIGSDSATYAWFVWGEGFSGVHMLDSTPLAVRNAQKPAALEFQRVQGSLFGGGT